MSEAAARVEDLFASGRLIRPRDDAPNLVHLVRALATIAGVQDLDHSPATKQLIDLIGPTEHLIFVLLDGMGMNVMRWLPENSFLRRNLQLEMHSISPSTTACALTSIATAEYPGRHGVAGWFTHLPEYGLTMTTLPFVERFTNQPLAERGLKPEDVLPAVSFQPKMTRQPLTLLPYIITHTAYANYLRGHTPGQGYASYHHAIDLIIERVTTATAPTFTHLYLPDVDGKCHHTGVQAEALVSLLCQIDADLSRMAVALDGRARIVVTADHGLIDVAPAQQTLLQSDDPLLKFLLVPPSGDARMPVFHVKPDHKEEFADSFTARFGEDMILLDTDDADRLRIFNPSGPLGPQARFRFGDFVAIAHRPAALAFHPSNKPLGNLYIALHAGLSPQEMEIPLIVA